MKEKKKLIISIVVIILVSIISIVILNMAKEKRIAENNVELVKSNYENLSSNIKKYNEIREKYHDMRANFTLDNYENEHDDYQTLLKEYNNIMKSIDSAVYGINIRCNQIYLDSTANNICTNYKTIYEKLVNLYVSDLLSYNKGIAEYNEYKETELKTFEMIHNEYIDYNHDNIYEGRENNE